MEESKKQKEESKIMAEHIAKLRSSLSKHAIEWEEAVVDMKPALVSICKPISKYYHCEDKSGSDGIFLMEKDEYTHLWCDSSGKLFEVFLNRTSQKSIKAVEPVSDLTDIFIKYKLSACLKARHDALAEYYKIISTAHEGAPIL